MQTQDFSSGAETRGVQQETRLTKDVTATGGDLSAISLRPASLTELCRRTLNGQAAEGRTAKAYSHPRIRCGRNRSTVSRQATHPTPPCR